jgi:hypothetical protein
VDACDDGDESASQDKGASSFASIVRRLRHRQGRAIDPNERTFDRFDLAEKLFVALYEPADEESRGWLRFFDVSQNPPKTGRPVESALLDLDGLANSVKKLVTQRNTAGFDWETAVAETELDESEED